MRKHRAEIVRRILCATLVVFTIALNFKHVSDLLQLDVETRHAMAATFLSETVIVGVLILGLIASALFLFRATFQFAVALQSLSILIIIGLQIHASHMHQALLQVPFLCATLMMIYLGYPFEAEGS